MSTRCYAFDLDALPTRLAVLEYLSVIAKAVTRTAEALEQGNAGRPQALEELSMLQVLTHYLSRRLSEPCPPDPDDAPSAPDGGGVSGSAARARREANPHHARPRTGNRERGDAAHPGASWATARPGPPPLTLAPRRSQNAVPDDPPAPGRRRVGESASG